MQLSDSGSYAVLVSNTSSNVTSSAATLTVVVGVPVISSQPQSLTNNAGTTAIFTVVSGGTAPLDYQWRKNGVDISGATLDTLTLNNVQDADVASYTVTVSNTAGSDTSTAATLTVINPPAIIAQPSSVTTNVNKTVSFSVGATGTAPLSYQWSKGGVALSDAGNVSGSASPTLTLTSATGGDAGGYAVLVSNPAGSVLSATAQLLFNGRPVITLNPTNKIVAVGSNVTMIVKATGTNLSYQWRFNGNNIAGATSSASLVVLNAQLGDAGSYDAVVSNGNGGVASAAATLAVHLKPLVTAQPQNVAANVGSNAIFSVSVSGTGPFKYQWKKGTAPLGGETNSVYTRLITGSATDAGTYSVAITNAVGFVISSNATLSVNAPPVLGKQSGSHTNLVGTSNAFYVVATGTAPISYQWQYNGSDLVGATKATNLVSDIVLASAGSYSVVVSNVAGVVTSSNLVLSVNPDTNAPSITISTPAANQITTSNVFRATGGAADNAQVTNVLYSLNGGAYQSAATTNRWKNWFAVLDGQLLAKTNTLRIKARDFSGNESVVTSLQTKSFLFLVPSTLTVITNGTGTITGSLDQQSLNVGQNYTMTATPGVGQVFTNWQVGATSSLPAKLTFTMQTNLVISANFIPSPFTTNVTGTYSGLFYEAGGVAFPSSGFLTLTVNSNGLFSGKVYLEGASFSIMNALFDASGAAHLSVSRSLAHKSTLSVDLQIDLTGGSDTVTGTVSSPVDGWSAPCWADRATYSLTSPTANAGKYTFVIPGIADPTQGPLGIGSGEVTVSPAGAVSLAGYLGDETKMAQAALSVSVSKGGLWPLYMPLYAGKGALLSWVSLTNAPGVATNLTASVVWVKLAGANATNYPGGFTNLSDVAGSGYASPLAGQRIVALTNATFTLDGGNLLSPITASVFVTNSTLTVTGPNPNGIKLTTTPANGALSGSFTNPVSGTLTKFNGVLVRDGNYGAGEFLSPNQAGYFFLGE